MMTYQKGLLSSDILIKRIRDRQLTVHIYNDDIIENIYYNIEEKYFFAFKELLESLKKSLKSVLIKKRGVREYKICF